MIHDISLGSDGGCTGFGWAQWLFPKIGQCCSVHDAGGSDGALLDCLQMNLPAWAWVPAALGVAGMILFRPLYNLMQLKGWVK